MNDPAANSSSDFKLTPVTGAFGVQIDGLEVRSMLATPGFADRLTGLLAEFSVLFFPAQHLSPAEMRALASLFGVPDDYAPTKAHAGTSRHPDIHEMDVVVSPFGGEHNHVDAWHMDNSDNVVPQAIAILQAVSLPPWGGDTLWSDQRAALAALSEPMKEMLRSLTGLHVRRGAEARVQEHPLVAVHPVSRREFLYINTGRLTVIPQLRRKESRLLLDYLREFSAQPEFTLRRAHSKGDLVIWDNRCTQHYGVHDYAERREIWRIGVIDGRPLEASRPDRIGPHFDRRLAGAQFV